MDDIFLSYHSGDREKALALLEILEGAGWSVWWDRRIPTGRTYHEVIEEALANSRCVVVLWSSQSVWQEWVVNEAQVGADRQVLVPVLLDDVSPPLGFRRLQAAPLAEWDGSTTFRPLLRLLDDLGDLMRRDTPSRTARDPRPPPQWDRRRNREVRDAVGILVEAGMQAHVLGKAIEGWLKGLPDRRSETRASAEGESEREPATIARHLGQLVRAVPDLFSTKRIQDLADLGRKEHREGSWPGTGIATQTPR